jgi:hypothetical protein
MKFKTNVTVYGMKASKGTMDNGMAFDSCKIYCLADMDERKGNMKGQAAVEYTIGEAAEFDKFRHLSFPFEAEASFEIVSTGSTQRTIVSDLVPISLAKPAKAS